MPNAFHYANTFDDMLAAQFKGILSQGFDPRQIEDMLLWLDAYESSTILKDGSNLVAKWLDRSGRCNHAVQNNEAKKPTYNSVGLNSRPTLTFSGKHLIAPSINIGELTIFAVFTNDNVYPIGGSDVDFVISHDFNVSTANGFINTSEPQFRQESLTSTSYYLGGELQAGNNTALQTGVPYLGSMVASRTQSASAIGIGGHRSGSGFGDYRGNLSEIILFGRKLTDGQRQLVEAYLSAKWNIPLQS